MDDVQNGVWPPVYDFETLESQIKQCVNTGSLFDEFYLPYQLGTELCQGDIIQLDNEIPFIDKDGEINAIRSAGYCIVLGNSCDLSREKKTVPFTQICPLFRIEPDISDEKLNKLKKYEPYRKFYLPTWEYDNRVLGYLADFTITCSIDRCVIETAIISARMQFLSWIIFNSCILRYLARADKRYT
jgi:hypothetical protein